MTIHSGGVSMSRFLEVRPAILSLAFALLLAVPAARAADAPPSDAAIAHIAYTADLIDIRYAHIALAISQSPAIREFAETMLRDHSAVNTAALELLGKLKVTPEDNATSRSLLEGSTKKAEELLALRGEAFDRAYATNELAYHQAVNQAVGGTLLPAVRNREFKALLGKALTTFKAHEQHAAHMVAALR